MFTEQISSWKDRICRILPNPIFFEPVAYDEIITAENILHVVLPESLKILLLETDGVTDVYGSGHIWNCSRLCQDNANFRQNKIFKSIYMSFDHLLFFADAGNGDQFAFVVVNGVCHDDPVIIWNHEDDSRQWYASSLEQYIEYWLGNLKPI